VGEVAWEEGFNAVREDGVFLGSQFGSPVLRDEERMSLVQK